MGLTALIDCLRSSNSVLLIDEELSKIASKGMEKSKKIPRDFLYNKEWEPFGMAHTYAGTNKNNEASWISNDIKTAIDTKTIRHSRLSMDVITGMIIK